MVQWLIFMFSLSIHKCNHLKMFYTFLLYIICFCVGSVVNIFELPFSLTSYFVHVAYPFLFHLYIQSA
jgi:hypothetical protein